MSPTGACTAAHDSDPPSVSRIYEMDVFTPNNEQTRVWGAASNADTRARWYDGYWQTLQGSKSSQQVRQEQ